MTSEPTELFDKIKVGRERYIRGSGKRAAAKGESQWALYNHRDGLWIAPNITWNELVATGKKITKI